MFVSRLPARLTLLGALTVLVVTCGKSDSGGSSVTGPGSDFAPTSNTTLSGTVSYKSVTIPAGVTVTVSSDLTLTTTGDVTLSGTLQGDCVAVTITAGGQFVNSGGTISNSCSVDPAAGPPGVLVIGTTGINASGGTVTTSGNLRFTNDPTQTLGSSNVVSAASAAPRPEAANSGTVPCQFTNYTTRSIPSSRSNGAAGSPKGADGADGHYHDLGPCVGGIQIAGLTMSGQKGGDGGTGTVTGSTQAVGGKGGNAGAILITAPSGDIVFSGTNTINTPDGGRGGDATGTGLPAGSASALGGAGGDEAPTGFGGSPILIQAATGSITVNGNLVINVGTAGAGGNATATGGNGVNPGQAGGPATATAGAGGKTANATFTATGAVGGTGTITVTGGNAGNGGNATANGGTGAAGNPGQTGGAGGTMTAQGGNGGNAQLKNAQGILIGIGGNAGNATYTAGNGANGGSNCPNAGGAGGAGGSAVGGAGNPGTGAPAGAAGKATASNAGNGAKGGDGNAPGAGGAAGGNSPPANPAPGSFQPGTPGAPCAGTGSQTISVVPSSQSVNEGSTVSVSVLITRSTNFTGADTIRIKDPSGNVVISFVTSPGATNAGFQFTIAQSVPAGTYTYTATANGDGAPATVSQTFIITVTVPASFNVTYKNGAQATQPWTLFAVKTGSGTTVSETIGSDGSVTIPVPTTATPMVLMTQQQTGSSNNVTTVVNTTSTDILNGAVNLNINPTGSFSYAVLGTPPNAAGTSFVGAATTFWGSINSSPFTVPLTGATLGQGVVYGCSVNMPTGEPKSVILWTSLLTNGGTSTCDFGGSLVKTAVATTTTVTGATPGTTFDLYGGYSYQGVDAMSSHKTLAAPSATYSALNSSDLPFGVGQWQRLVHNGTTSFEQSTYYYSSGLNWSFPMLPALNTPTVTINNSFNGYYQFHGQMSLQVEYSVGWQMSYTQTNGSGGQNSVSVTTYASYLSNLPPTIDLFTPAEPLLNPLYMPSPSFGAVTGSFTGYSYRPFSTASLGDTRNYAVRFNLSF